MHKQLRWACRQRWARPICSHLVSLRVNTCLVCKIRLGVKLKQRRRSYLSSSLAFFSDRPLRLLLCFHGSESPSVPTATSSSLSSSLQQNVRGRRIFTVSSFYYPSRVLLQMHVRDFQCSLILSWFYYVIIRGI